MASAFRVLIGFDPCDDRWRSVDDCGLWLAERAGWPPQSAVAP